MSLFPKILSVSMTAFLAACPMFLHASHDDDADVIPKPLVSKMLPGEAFILSAKTRIVCENSLKPQADFLAQTVQRVSGFDLLDGGKGKTQIRLLLDTTIVSKPEGYRLEVSSKGISIIGHDATGVFYGIQTLLQYFPKEIYSAMYLPNKVWTVPAVVVEDAPNRPWRGMMLDAARYYYDISFVKKFVDMMAMYKLNKLQFHFIDDSGWRLEIKKYPRLTEVGAWSGSGPNRIGGFYTQEQMRELIDYAAVRGVEIIPEIEFPAHILSAVVAYPWISCTGLQHEVPGQHFISRDLLCVGKERSLQFLRDVLDEVVDLFPSKVINIGGDEAVYDRWKTCPDCQALMKREGLTKVSELQGWLTNVVAGWMKEKGRTVMGWEEIIMRGKVETPVIGVIWHNVADTLHATKTGHKAVLTPASHLYFDFPESNTPGEPQHATWMPYIPLKKAYSMPLNDYSATSTTLGVQGCLWSDQFIHGTRLQEIALLNENRSENYVEYFVMPRMLALSELAWTPQAGRDYTDFEKRLAGHYSRLDAAGYNYRVPEPRVKSLRQNADGTWTYVLTKATEKGCIRYTTDGTWPTVHSPIYNNGEEITVKNKADLLAITVITPLHYSLPLYTAPDYSAYAHLGTYTASWQPLKVQTVPAQMRFECTGKISGNGKYEVSFVNERGENHLKLGTLKVMKRNEVVATVEQVATTTPTATYTFTIDSFEAGTPFYLDVQACGEGGNDTVGLVFVKKVE